VGNTPLKAGSYRSNNCDPEFLDLAARMGKETHPTIAGIAPSTPCLHKRPCVQMSGAETNDEDFSTSVNQRSLATVVRTG
jgi:hypothetical protein